MALIDQTLNSDNITQGKEIKRAAFAAELWSEAQQSVSKLKGIGTKSVMMDGTWKSFDRIKKREFTAKTKSLVATPSSAQEYDRRILITESYHDALQIDPDDLVNSRAGILDEASAEMKKSLGRLCDRVILEALVSPVFTLDSANKKLDDPSASSTSNDLLSFTTNVSKSYQGNVYFDDTVATIDVNTTGTNDPTTVKTLVNSDSLEDILYLFRKRDAMDRGRLICTLTPEFARILRKDSDFKNAERTFRPSEAVQMPFAGFEYRNIWFVPISESVLPAISDATIGASVTGARSHLGDIPIVAAKLSGSAIDPTEGSQSAVTAASSGTITKSATRAVAGTAQAADADYKVLRVKKENVVHFWSSEALYFSTREQLTFSSRDERVDYSMAKQHYMRVHLGSLLIDADFACSLVIRGAGYVES